MRGLSVLLLGLCLWMAGCDDDAMRPTTPLSRSLELLVSVPSLENPEVQANQPIASAVGLFSRDLAGVVGAVLDNTPAAYNGYKWYLRGVESVQLGTDSLTLYGYYPFDPSWTDRIQLPVAAGTTDYLYGQHDLKNRGYVCADQPVAHLRMRHALSCLSFDLRPILQQGKKVGKLQLRADEFTDKPVGRATLNIQTGELTPVSLLNTTLTATMNREGTTANLFLIPSEQVTIWVGLELKGQMMWVSRRGLDLASGKQYNFLLDYDVKEEAMVIREMTIQDWNEGPGIDLGDLGV